MSAMRGRHSAKSGWLSGLLTGERCPCCIRAIRARRGDRTQFHCQHWRIGASTQPAALGLRSSAAEVGRGTADNLRHLFADRARQRPPPSPMS
jgi:hypothetical protein